MKNTYYPAVFHPEEVGYSVFVPDIEGCSTQGDTMDEAVEMAKDAIGLMLEGLSEYPQPPIPSAPTQACLLLTSPSPRGRQKSRMPASA